VLKSINTKLITRVVLCLALPFTLWCRGQVADDMCFVQRPDRVSLQVHNSIQGLGIQFEIEKEPSPGSGAGEWCGCEAQPKYNRLWQHVYFNCWPLIVSSASRGARAWVTDFPSTWELQIELPHALLAFVLILLVRFESTLRRRRIKPGHCDRCGYDIRFCNQVCSECGTSIAAMSAAAAARRVARVCAIACPVLVVVLHAFCLSILYFRLPMRFALAPLEGLVSYMSAWPVRLPWGPFGPEVSIASCLLLGFSVSVNCLFWGLILEKVALTLQWFWECVVKLRGQKHNIKHNILPQASVH
jgi:hypothetical protein